MSETMFVSCLKPRAERSDLNGEREPLLQWGRRCSATRVVERVRTNRRNFHLHYGMDYSPLRPTTNNRRPVASTTGLALRGPAWAKVAVEACGAVHAQRLYLARICSGVRGCQSGW